MFLFTFTASYVFGWEYSHDKSYGDTTEINRDNETLKLPSQASSNQSGNAGDEYGDDQSMFCGANQVRLQWLTIVQAGILEEMMEDTLEMDEDEEIEEEADAEVDKVLFDLTNGKLGQAGTVATEIPVRAFLLIRVYYSLKEEDVAIERGPTRRRRDGKSYGTVPAAAQWAP